MEDLMESVIKGMDDSAYNVKITCLLLIDKLADACPQLVLDNFTRLDDPLSKSLVVKVNKN